MIRRFRGPILLGMVTIFAILLLTGDRGDELQDIFEVEAIYDESGIVKVSFSDKSEKTSTAVLQILGMEESFQKTFSGNEFVEEVSFPDVPKYGWKTQPVVIDIEHAELGHVQVKTEIYSPGEPVPPVIYSRP